MQRRGGGEVKRLSIPRVSMSTLSLNHRMHPVGSLMWFETLELGFPE